MKGVHCYDNGGETFDRYTAVYTAPETSNNGSTYYTYVGMSEDPFHPQGFGQHGESRTPIDYPSGIHLGCRIEFEDLPKKCQQLVLQDLGIDK